MRVARLLYNSNSGQIQDGGRPPNFQRINRCNSASDSSISLRFGTWVRFGSEKIAQVLTSTYHKIQGGGPPPNF